MTNDTYSPYVRLVEVTKTVIEEEIVIVEEGGRREEARRVRQTTHRAVGEVGRLLLPNSYRDTLRLLK